MEQEELPIAVNPLIFNEKGELLLGRRINQTGEFTYGLPGGKLRKGETLEQCTLREIREETGLVVRKENIEVVNLSTTIMSKHFLQIGVVIKKWEGVLQNMEPSKCDDLCFFPLSSLPPLFEPNRLTIELYQKQVFYDKNLNIE